MKDYKMICSPILSVGLVVLVVLLNQASAELSLDEIEKANLVLRKHCQPVSGVTDGVLEASMKGDFADDRGLKCYLACMMGLSHSLKNGQFRADLAIRLADDILPTNIKDRARAVVEKCRTAGDGLADECEMAFAIKKCAYQADPEIYYVQ